MEKNCNIKLVFFDIDGTLLTTQGEYTSRLVQQIRRLQGQGIKTAIASGRPSYTARFLIEEVGIADIGVFCTGAEIYDPKKQQHLHLHTLDNTLITRLYERTQELGIYCEFYTPQYHTVNQTCDISDIHSKHLRVSPTLIEGSSLMKENPEIIKLLLGCKQGNEGGHGLKQLAEEFPMLEFAFAHFLPRPEWEFASVISSAANKHQAFDQVLNYYGLQPAEVMAMGDSHSDMVFIQRAGIGVAMGNASEPVKAVADYVTLSADEDGAAFALEQLIA